MPDRTRREPGGWNRIVVTVNDVGATCESLKTLGAYCRNQPLSGPGGTQVLVDDPDGNPIELFQPSQ